MFPAPLSARIVPLVLNNFAYVSESETEPFHVMYVACRYAEETVEYLFQIFFLDADTIIFHGDQQLSVLVPSACHQCKQNFRAALFNRIIHQD